MIQGAMGVVIDRLRNMIHGWGRSARDTFALLPRTRINYEKEVGDPTKSDVVMGCILWAMRTFPEAPLSMRTYNADGEEEQVHTHRLLSLIRRPNPAYPSGTLWASTVLSYLADGNAYWLKVRGNANQPIQLWWAPHEFIEPYTTEYAEGTEFISYYRYVAPGLGEFYIQPEDVVHFRLGQDPMDPRKGLSPTKSVMREIFSDAEAANWTAALLRNGAVPGVIVAPDLTGTSGNRTPPPKDIEDMKARIKENFTGDSRGEPLVLGRGVQLTQFGYSPAEMDLKELRRLPEERVSSQLGIPAIVAGLGAGLERCLPGDSRVWTLQGAKRIRDIRPGAQVWSEVDGKLQVLPVTNWGKTGVQPVYEIRTKNRTIRSSCNHPILVRIPGSMTVGSNEERRVRYGYKRADEIEVGDYVVQVKSLPDQGGTVAPNGYEVTPGMMQWLGAMVGDGNITDTTIRMAMPPDDRCHDEYVSLAQGLFTRQARASGGSIAIQETIERAPITVGVRERDFGFRTALWARTLKEWGFKGTAKTKRVPGWVYGLRRDLRLAFLAGVVDSDGSIGKKGLLKLSLANKALVHDIRDLMIGCGIQCSNVGYGEIPGHRLPNPGRRMFYPYWTFTASSAKEISEIPFSDPLYRERVEANMQRYRSSGFDAYKTELNPDELGFFVVRSVTVKGGEMLYDIEVGGGGHNFIADGVVVSNSTFSNFAEARESAFENGIIPMQSVMAETLMHQLLEPHYMRGMNGNSTPELYFDLSRVRVLQEDRVAQAERLSTLFQGGVITRAEARQELGHEVHEYDKVYMVSSTFVERPVDMPPDALQPPQAMVLPPGVDQPQLMPPNGLEGDTDVIEGQVVNGDAASDTECPTCGEIHWPHCEDCDDDEVVAEEQEDDSDMPDDDEGDASDSDGDDDMPDDDSDDSAESEKSDDEDDDDDEEPPPPRRRRRTRPRRRIRTKQSPFDQPGGKPGAAGGLRFKAQTEIQKRLIKRLTARLPELSADLESTLYKGFHDFGDFIFDNLADQTHLFEDIISGVDDTLAGYEGATIPFDLTLEDVSGVMESIDSMAIEQWKDEVFGQILEQNAKTVTADTIRILEEELELPFDIPDDVAREIIATGGKRVGLIDFNKNTKAAVFNALRDGRAAGEGVDTLMRRIRDYVPAGRFVNAGPEYRSRMIARIESKWAQNKSTLEIYRNSEFVTGCMAFDAQLGADRSDPDCIARNGKTFTPDQAEREQAQEHPNGTLSWAPVIGEPIEPEQPEEKVVKPPPVPPGAIGEVGTGVEARGGIQDLVGQSEKDELRRLETRVDDIESEMRQRRARHSELTDEINTMILSSSQYPDKAAFESQLAKLQAERDNELKLHTNLSGKVRPEAKRALELKNNEVRDLIVDKVLAHNDRGYDFDIDIKKTFSKRQKEKIQADVSVFARVMRGNDEHSGNAIHFKKAGNSYAHAIPMAQTKTPGRYEIGLRKEVGRKTTVHEMGHTLEYADPELFAEALEFQHRRTAGDKPVGMSYSPKTKTRPDDFIDEYSGYSYKTKPESQLKFWDNSAVDPWDDDGYIVATELISTGVAHIVMEPLRLATEDPELFDFIFDRVLRRYQ